MIYPPKESTGTQRILLSRKKRRRLKRKQCALLSNEKSVIQSLRKKRNHNKILHIASNGVLKSLIPAETYWYKSYIVSPHLINPKFHLKFRRRFRVPYGTFQKLLKEVTDHPLFSRWHPSKIVIQPKLAPIGLLLLGSLWYLGRGWTFDDLEETTGICEEVHRIFFHKYIKFGREVLYPRYVKYPKNSEDAKTHMHEFNIAGLNGGVDSMDACYVTIETCSH